MITEHDSHRLNFFLPPVDPQANLKMGVIITKFGEYRRVCYYQPPYPELSEKYWWTSVIGMLLDSAIFHGKLPLRNVHHHFSDNSGYGG